VLPAGDLETFGLMSTPTPLDGSRAASRSRAAADLEQGGSRRDVEPDDPLDRFVVVPVLPLPSVGIRCLRVQQGYQAAFRVIVPSIVPVPLLVRLTPAFSG